MKGAGGKDTLSDIEFIRFSDRTVAVGEIVCRFGPDEPAAGKDAPMVLPGSPVSPESPAVLPGLDAEPAFKASRPILTDEAWLL